MKLMAYVLIPGYTLLFTKGYSWFTMNFSVIGNLMDKYKAFLLWGILVGGYFYMMFRKIKASVSLTPVCSRLIPAALVLLFCAITTPYLPQELPFKSVLHILFAFLSAVLLVLFLFLVVWFQYLRFPELYRPFLWGLGGIAAVSAFLLVTIGIVSTALEIFVTFTTVVMTDRLLYRLTHNAGAGTPADANTGVYTESHYILPEFRP